MSDLPAAALAAVAEALAVHRWKTMGVASVECECGAILTGDADPFPADEAFRSHIAAEALAAAGPHLAAEHDAAAVAAIKAEASAVRELEARIAEVKAALAESLAVFESRVGPPRWWEGYADDAAYKRWCDVLAGGQ